MNKNTIKKLVKEKTSKDCEVKTYYCNSDYRYVEGETLTEFKQNLKEEGIRYSELINTYRLVEIYLIDEDGNMEDDRWEWCEGNTIEEAYKKIYNLIKND